MEFLGSGRRPRCTLAQVLETFGESPRLVADMGVAMVKGYQEGPSPIAACLKHYMGYSRPLSGKDRTPARSPSAS